MSSTPVFFHCEDIEFSLQQQAALQNWVAKVVATEAQLLGEVNFIFCSDSYLLNINQQYLQHDTYTDIITFDYGEDNTIAGDIFISVERVHENATKYAATPSDELHRVMVHGVLHLLGYKDKAPSDKAEMTDKEDFYLSLRAF